MTGRRRDAGLAILVLACALPAAASDRFVAVTGSDTGACTTSASPCRTVTYAVGQATSGDTVKVSAGRYDERVEILSSIDLTVSGGWSPDFAVHDANANPTLLRGAAGSPNPGLPFADVFFVAGSSGDVITLAIEGVILTRATRGVLVVADQDAQVNVSVTDSTFTRQRLGAVSIESHDSSLATVTLTGCTLVKNALHRAFAVPLGGGAVNAHADGTNPLTVRLIDSTFDRNRAPGARGGAVYVEAAGGMLELEIADCTFFRNRARFEGGGAVYAVASAGGPLDVSIAGSLLTDNIAPSAAALDLVDFNSGSPLSTLTIANSAFVANESVGDPSTVFIYSATGTMTNVTVTRNRARDSGGAVLVVAGTMTLRNVVMWDNDDTNADVRPDGGAVIDADHNDTQDGVFTNDLGGNIAADPLLAADGVHLIAGSPCIDAGTCTGAPADDIDGDARPAGAGCDMGADERVP